MPTEEVERLAAHSYDLVRAKLARKQRAEFGSLSS
jgi:predicted DNA-binding protein (MmcQ/YjbR family)